MPCEGGFVERSLKVSEGRKKDVAGLSGALTHLVRERLQSDSSCISCVALRCSGLRREMALRAVCTDPARVAWRFWLGPAPAHRLLAHLPWVTDLPRSPRHAAPKSQQKDVSIEFQVCLLFSQCSAELKSKGCSCGFLATSKHQMSTVNGLLHSNDTDDTGLFRDVSRSGPGRGCRCHCFEAFCKAPRIEAARSCASSRRFCSLVLSGRTCAPARSTP